jgi:hypothetical protein
MIILVTNLGIKKSLIFIVKCSFLLVRLVCGWNLVEYELEFEYFMILEGLFSRCYFGVSSFMLNGLLYKLIQESMFKANTHKLKSQTCHDLCECFHVCDFVSSHNMQHRSNITQQKMFFFNGYMCIYIYLFNIGTRIWNTHLHLFKQSIRFIIMVFTK